MPPCDPKYADIVLARMESAENPLGRSISTRELASGLGRSYEHCRKVIVGEPVVSKEFNDQLCAYLDLNAEKMWSLAQEEKAFRRFSEDTVLRTLVSSLPKSASAPDFGGDWQDLKDEDRTVVTKLVHQLAEANRTQRRKLEEAVERHATTSRAEREPATSKRTKSRRRKRAST